MKQNLKWITNGIQDFLKIVLVGSVLIVFCFIIIKSLVSIGMQPEYASTVISLCLLFTGSMMFSYFEFKRESLSEKKKELLLASKNKSNKTQSK